MMAERNIPEELWDVNITIVRKHIEEYDVWEALQSDEEGGSALDSAFQSSQQKPKPILPEDMKFLLKMVQFNAPIVKLKKLLRKKNIPQSKWSTYIDTTKQYVKDYDAWVASNEPENSREEGETTIHT